MASIRQAINKVARNLGYTGQAPRSIAGAVTALGTVLGGSGGGARIGSLADPLCVWSVSGTGAEVAEALEWETVEDPANKFYPVFNTGVRSLGNNFCGLAYAEAEYDSGRTAYSAQKFSNGQVLWMQNVWVAQANLLGSGDNGVYFYLYTDTSDNYTLKGMLMITGQTTADEAISIAKARVSGREYMKISVMAKELAAVIATVS